MVLPEDYVSSKFFRFVGLPKRNKIGNTYQGCCPICREGDSWLSKRRFYYIPSKNRVFCHNCGYNETPLEWIKEIEGLTFSDIKNELDNNKIDVIPVIEQKQSTVVSTLPKDSINLLDPLQLEYYKTNKVVRTAFDFLQTRMLLDSVNAPKAYYISLTDFVHKNRLIIPFYDEKNKIVHYQTRKLVDDNKPRYMSKIGSEKTLFNINNVSLDLDTIFIFVGPFNSCFVENGVAVAGIQEGSYQLFTPKQLTQINNYPTHDKIWVLDSQWIDSAGREKSKKLLELGERVFIWPETVGRKYKDFNDICIDLKAKKISAEYIKKYTFSGDEGIDKLLKCN